VNGAALVRKLSAARTAKSRVEIEASLDFHGTSVT